MSETLRDLVVDPNTLRMNEYFVVGTSLREDFSAAQILHIYMLRWQVEIAFKRLKSIMQLGQLPKTDPESCRAWLYGKMLYALLCYAIVDAGRSFFPMGVYAQNTLKRMKACGVSCPSPCCSSVRPSDHTSAFAMR